MDNALRFALADRLQIMCQAPAAVAWDLAGELMAEEADPRALFMAAETSAVERHADEMQRAVTV